MHEKMEVVKEEVAPKKEEKEADKKEKEEEDYIVNEIDMETKWRRYFDVWDSM